MGTLVEIAMDARKVCATCNAINNRMLHASMLKLLRNMLKVAALCFKKFAKGANEVDYDLNPRYSLNVNKLV